MTGFQGLAICKVNISFSSPEAQAIPDCRVLKVKSPVSSGGSITPSHVLRRIHHNPNIQICTSTCAQRYGCLLFLPHSKRKAPHTCLYQPHGGDVCVHLHTDAPNPKLQLVGVDTHEAVPSLSTRTSALCSITGDTKRAPWHT